MSTSTATPEQKLEIAAALNKHLAVLCETHGCEASSEMLLLAFYARTEPHERAALLVNGLK